MTISRTPLAIIGLVLFSVSLQAGFVTDTTAAGGTFTTSEARALNGVPFGGSGSNFACPGGGTSSAGSVGSSVTNSFANTTCQSGRAFASADLVTGTLRGFALSSGIPGTTAFESAQWGDELTFDNTTSGDLLLNFSYLTHATVTGETMGIGTTTSLASNLLFGQPGGSQQIGFQGGILRGLRFVYTNGSTSIQDPNAGGPPTLGGWTVSPVGPVGALFSGTLIVHSGISTLDISTFLILDCRSGADCDASNTAAFSFGALPAALSFTSSSGVFLTGKSPSAVPEPGTWAMLGVGALSFAFQHRKRRIPLK